MTTKPITCWIYSCSKKADLYLYLAKKADFEILPDALLSQLGVTEEVMSLELTEQRTLARVDVKKVMIALNDVGYFLQVPPTVKSLL